MRRQFFVNEDEPEEGFLEKNKRESFAPPNPMQDPAQVSGGGTSTHVVIVALSCLAVLLVELWRGVLGFEAT